LEALRNRRVLPLPLRQRTERGGIVVNKDRATQVLLNACLEKVVDDNLGVLAGSRYAGLFCDAPDSVPVFHRHADVLSEQVGVTGSLPGWRVIYHLIAIGKAETASQHLDAGDDEALRQIHHAAVIRIGLV